MTKFTHSVTLKVKLYNSDEVELTLPRSQVASYLDMLLEKYPGTFTIEVSENQDVIELIPREPITELGCFQKKA